MPNPKPEQRTHEAAAGAPCRGKGAPRGESLSRTPPSDPRGRSTPARRQVSTLEGTVLPRKTGRAEFNGVRGIHLRIPDSTHVPRWGDDAARRRGPKHWDHADAVGGPQRTGVLLGTRHQHPLGRWPSNRPEDALHSTTPARRKRSFRTAPPKSARAGALPG